MVLWNYFEKNGIDMTDQKYLFLATNLDFNKPKIGFEEFMHFVQPDDLYQKKSHKRDIDAMMSNNLIFYRN